MVIIDLNKLFEIEINTFNFIFKRQFVQRDEEERLYLIVFFSKKLYKLELNYLIYNKELMAIIELFKEWKLYFNGTKYQVKVYTNYKNLIYFIISKDLNQRQIQWLEFFNEFNFQIIYKKGSENGRINVFNRKLNHFERKKNKTFNQS